MLHNLTVGHLDTTLVAERGSRVLKPLEDGTVQRHLNALAVRRDGDWILGGGKVEFRNGCVIVPWLSVGTNFVAEEFALRMVRDTGCQLIDLEHGRVIDPTMLRGSPKNAVRKPFLARARRLMENRWKRG